jgi:hypothetical protein
MLGPDQIADFLKKIQAAQEQLANDKSLLPLYNLEASLTLFQLKNVLSSTHLRGEMLSGELIHILSRRWECIESMDIEYLHDFSNPANKVCITVAIELGKLLGKPYLSLLMPSLTYGRVADYISSFYDDDLDLKDSVLSDCSRRIVSVSDVLSSAQVDGVLKHNSLFNGKAKKLSATEEARVLSRHSTVKDAYDALQARVKYKLHGDTVGAHLNRLISGLRAGGVRKAGSEMDSGSDANTAILEFAEYLETLAPETRAILMSAKKIDRFAVAMGAESMSVSQLWGRLARPKDAEYTSSIFCVEVIAGYLEEILTENPELYDLASYEGGEVSDLAKLEKDVTKAGEAMIKGLATVEKHACYGDRKDDTLRQELFRQIISIPLYPLTIADIVFIANNFAAIYPKKENFTLLRQYEDMLVAIARYQSSEHIIQALNEVTAEAKGHFLRVTRFKEPAPPSHFFGPGKRRAGAAELDTVGEIARESHVIPKRPRE